MMNLIDNLRNKASRTPGLRLALISGLMLLISVMISIAFVVGCDKSPFALLGTAASITIVLTLIATLGAYVCIYGSDAKIRWIKASHDFFSGLSYEKKCTLAMYAAVLFTCLFVFLKMGYSGLLYAYYDIGADTTDQYIPWYVHVINAIRDGSFSSFEGELGFGNDFGARIGNMNDPFTLFAVFLGVIFGSRHIVTYLVISRFLLFIASAAVCYRFVSLFSKNPLACALASYIFAYNSFTVIWGQHYMFACYPLYMVALLYSLEIALRRENRCNILLVLISFASIIDGVYIVYMMYLPAIFYTLIRYFAINDSFSFSHFLKKAGTLLANVFLGFMGGMIIGISSVIYILSSDRVGGGLGESIKNLFSYFTDWFGWDEFIFRLQRTVSGSLNGVGSYFEGTGYGFDFYNAAQIFFSVFFIIFALQFLFTLRKTAKSRKSLVLTVISVILVACAIFNKGFAFLMYCLSGFSSRPIFVILPFFAIMTAIVIDNIFYKRILNKFALLLGMIITEFLLLKSYFTLDSVNLSSGIVAIILTGLVFVLAVSYSAMKTAASDSAALRNASLAILAFALVTNITLETTVATSRLGAFPKAVYDEKYEMAENFSAALDYIESIDPDYYRVENTSFVFKPVHDSLMLGYNSVTMYESNMKTGLSEFNNYYLDQSNSTYPAWIFPVFSDSQEDIVPYSLLSLKYIISPSDTDFEVPLDNDNYEYLTTVDGFKIYQNRNVTSYTTFYTSAVLRSEFLTLSKPDRLRIISKCVVINDEDKDAFSDYLISAEDALASYRETDVTAAAIADPKDRYDSTADGYIEIALTDGWSDGLTSPFIEFSAASHSGNPFDVYYKTVGEYDWDNKITLGGNGGAYKSERIYLPKNVSSILLNFDGGTGDAESFKIYDSLESVIPADNPSVITEHSKDTYISGKITTDTAGIVFIPTVYDSQWNVEIDGESAEVYTANSGFIAVNVGEGEHTISITYSSISVKLGVPLLIISIALTALWYFEPRIRARLSKKKEVDEENEE